MQRRTQGTVARVYIPRRLWNRVKPKHTACFLYGEGKVTLALIEIVDALHVRLGVILDPSDGSIMSISFAESITNAVTVLNFRFDVASVVISAPMTSLNTLHSGFVFDPKNRF